MAKLNNLPYELSQMIATCGILRRSDLASLTLTNRQLYLAINGILYKTFGSPVAIEFAVKNGTLGTLEAAFSFGLDIHYDCDKPLHQACEKGQIEVIKWLLNHGSSVDTELVSGTFADASRSPLFTALLHKREDAALLLLELGAIPRFTFHPPNLHHRHQLAHRLSYYTALHIAVDKDMTRVMEFLVREHLQPIDESLHRCPSALVFMIERCRQNTQLSTFKKLIELGASVNAEASNNKVPLMVALKNGQYDYAKALLDAGAMINPRSTNPEIRNPIHACIMGSGRNFPAACAMLSRLIEAGADLEKNYAEEHTLLGQAVVHGHWKMIPHLLSLGVRVDGQNSSGRTPLDLFVDYTSYDDYQQEDKVLALLRGGARMDTPLFDGRTLLEWIIHEDWVLNQYNNHPSSAHLLEQLLTAATPAMLDNNYLDELLFMFFEPRYYTECLILTNHGATLKSYDQAYSTARDMISTYEHQQPHDSENHFKYFQMIAHASLPAEKINELMAYAREVGDEESCRALCYRKAT